MNANTTTTVEVGFVRLGETIVMPCGGHLTVDRFELGPEAGEVSFFTGTERYIFASSSQHVQVLHHVGQALS